MTECLTSLFSSLGLLGEMSVTAAYAAGVVLVVRLLLKKRAPRQVVCLLWLVVFARLLIPVSLKSPMSIVPNAIAGQEQVWYSEETPPLPGAVQTPPMQLGDGAQVPVLTAPDNAVPAPPPASQAAFPWQAAVAGMWLAGAVVMGGAGLLSYLRLRRRLWDAIRARDGAWEHPAVGSPFILGLFRPKIYLPVGLVGRPREFILCHERAHLRRLDHIVKPLCWAALALHWFNPVVWAAYILMSRDIEAACDEAVIRQLGSAVKADYSKTLLALATGGRIPAPCPLAFDEGDAKGRIKNVLRYRRPALWIVVVSVLAVALAAVCLLTDPVDANAPDGGPDADASASPSQYPDENGVLDPWMRDVLSGEGMFSLNGTALDIGRLAQAFYGGSQDAPSVTLSRFAVIDLDRDGVNELVVWPGIDGDDSVEQVSVVGYLILRRQGDEVLGYQPGFRTFAYLKEDGTFHWSGSAFNWGYGVMRFTEDGFEVDDVTWCEVRDPEENRYFVDRLRAEEEEFFAAVQAQDDKPDVQWYLYHYQNPMATDIALPIPLDEQDLSIPVPDFLGTEQQLLYRQAFAMYSHIFGASTESVDEWPAAYGFPPEKVVERNGMQYTPSTGRYGRWENFEEAVLSVFTPRLWAQRNSWGEGVPVYTDIDGRLYYIAAARGSYGYNDNFPVTFELARRTEDEIVFVMTGYYSEPYPREGESGEERDARLAADYEYSIDFPMRMVKTENGWRFDEFYCAYTDNAVPPFSGRKVPNMHTAQPAGEEPHNGWLLAATQQWEQEWGADYIELRQTGKELTLTWGEEDYPITEDASADQAGRYWIDMACGDYDGDGDTEVVLHYSNYNRGSWSIVVLYDRSGGRLLRSQVDTNELAAAFGQNTVAAYSRNSRTLTVTYSHTKGHMDDPDYDRRLITGSCVLPEGFFAGREALQDANLCPWIYSAGVSSKMEYSDSAQVACKLYFVMSLYLADDSLRGKIVREVQDAEHMVETRVGAMTFALEYDGAGFTVTPAEELDLEYPQP